MAVLIKEFTEFGFWSIFKFILLGKFTKKKKKNSNIFEFDK